MRSNTFKSPPKKNPTSRHCSTSMVAGDLPTTILVPFEPPPPNPAATSSNSTLSLPKPATHTTHMPESGQPSFLADSGQIEPPAIHSAPLPPPKPNPNHYREETHPGTPLRNYPLNICANPPRFLQVQKKRKALVDAPTSKSNRKQPRIAASSQGKKKAQHSATSLPPSPNGATVSAARTVRNTRYVDHTVLSTLGMTKDFHWLCNKLGMSSFINHSWPSYVELTTSFLSTFECEIINGPYCEQGRITFSLLRQPFALTLSEFAAIYGLPSTGPRRHSREFHDRLFWSSLSETLPYSSGTSRSTSIIHPCLRYFMRVLANTIFARGEMDMVVRKDELFVLWSAYHGPPACIAAFLARQFLRVKHRESSTIHIGGLITPIAHHFGIPTDNLTVASGPTSIDLSACKAMHIIDSTNAGYGVKYDSQHIFPLPYPDSYSIQDPAHFKTPLQYVSTVPPPDDHPTLATVESETVAPNIPEVTPSSETIESPTLAHLGPFLPTPSTQQSPQAPDSASHRLIQQLVTTQASMQTELREHMQILLELKAMMTTLLLRAPSSGPLDPPAS